MGKTISDNDLDVDDDEFRWIGPRVDSYNIGLTSSNNTFYKSFERNGTKYSIGDIVIFNDTNSRNNDKICRIMCVYESCDEWLQDEPHRGIIRWFRRAKSIFKNGTDDSEIIEDHDNIESVCVSLMHVQCKCAVTYLDVNNSKSSISSTDEKCVHNFYCRYKLKDGDYVPIFNDMKLLANNLRKKKRKTDAIQISESDDEDVKLIRSPLKNMKLSSVEKRSNNADVTPRRSGNVKRNLNDSFVNVASSTENTPTLNYSIVGDEEPLKVKLRMSERQDIRVILTRLDRELLHTHLSKLNDRNASRSGKEPTETTNGHDVTPRKMNVESSEFASTPRRSARKSQRISYADYLSPKKRHVSTDSERLGNVREWTPDKRAKGAKSATKAKRSESMRSNETPQKATFSTPRAKATTPSTAKLLRDGLITPTMRSRVSSVKTDATPLTRARAHLHVSYTPAALPCREKEFNDVYGFLRGKLDDGGGGCMYISGVPGTGKTATVAGVVQKLRDDRYAFDYVNVNGMRLTEAKQTYVEILRQLSGKTVPWEQAQTTLNDMFTKTKRKSSRAIILLIDELDVLCTRRQDVVYNLLDWPSKAAAQLIVITIANTMDLPERLLMGRVTSRLGLTRLTFQPYTHKQLQEIVTKRLIGTDAFNPDAVQLVARKVASVSGDARRALDICRRAAELAEVEGPQTLVSMTHVNEALNAMITQPKVQVIRHCPRLQQMILQSVVAEVERTGVEETNFADVFAMLTSIATIHGFRMVSVAIALKAVSYLAACRLLLTDSKSNDMDQRIILNASADDVYYALKED